MSRKGPFRHRTPSRVDFRNPAMWRIVSVSFQRGRTVAALCSIREKFGHTNVHCFNWNKRRKPKPITR